MKKKKKNQARVRQLPSSSSLILFQPWLLVDSPAELFHVSRFIASDKNRAQIFLFVISQGTLKNGESVVSTRRRSVPCGNAAYHSILTLGLDMTKTTQCCNGQEYRDNDSNSEQGTSRM